MCDVCRSRYYFVKTRRNGADGKGILETSIAVESCDQKTLESKLEYAWGLPTIQVRCSISRTLTKTRFGAYDREGQ